MDLLVPPGWHLVRLSITRTLKENFFFKFYYLFLERGLEGETSMCGCLACTPYWGPGPQPRATPARAPLSEF